MSEQEKEMFGETIEQMRAAKPDILGNGLYAAAILSDVQEVLARIVARIGKGSLNAEELELSRKWINKAKYFIDQEIRK